MIYVLICIACALMGLGLGLMCADRIAEQKIQEMRMQMGLDIHTGEPIDDAIDELYKELFEKKG